MCNEIGINKYLFYKCKGNYFIWIEMLLFYTNCKLTVNEDPKDFNFTELKF